MNRSLCFVLLFSALGSLASHATPPPGFAVNPVFDDEFDAGQVDLSKWDYRELGGLRGHARLTTDAVKVQDGHMTITTYSSPDASGTMGIFSGMISTEKSFLQTYGYWEASLRTDYQSGMQPAFWLQSPTVGRPPDDPGKAGVEMDIFEHTSRTPNPALYDHAFVWNGYGKSCRSWIVNRKFGAPTDGKFHTFGLAWTPAGYTFYVDGTVSRVVPPSEVPVSHAPGYIIFSTEAYSHIPAEGYGPLGKSKATFDVDYVRVYPYLGNGSAKP